MKRILTIALMLMIFSFQTFAENPNDNKFRIGAILPLTGAIPTFGDYVNKGLNLAYSQLPADLQGQVEIIVEDDSFNPTRTLSAYQKIAGSSRLDALLVVGSPAGNVLAPLVEQHKIPMIDIGASDFNVVKNRKYSFTHWVSPEEEAKAFVAEVKRRGYQRIAVVRTEHSGINAVYQGIKNGMQINGMSDRIVLDENVPGGETSFATFVAKARVKKVDGIVPILFSGMLSSFARKVREQKINADMFSIEVFEDAEVVKDAAGALENQWYVSGDDGSPELIKAYQAQYNEYPGWGVSNTVDRFHLLVEGYKRFGRDSEKITEYLSTFKDYHGASGTYSATGDQRFSLPAIIKVIQNNSFKKLHQ